mgnify:FL=1
MKDSVKHTVTSKPMADQCIRDIQAMVKEHGYCVVQIKAGGRSLEQNALFHVWCREFAAEQTKRGKDLNEETVKIWWKHRFLGTEDVRYGSKVLTGQLRNTEDLSVGEMFHFMEQCWEYSATEFGVYLPIPEDSHYMKDREKQNGQD